MGSIPTMRFLILGLTLLLAISLASGRRGRGNHHGHLVCNNGCKPTCTNGAMPLCADGTAPTERLFGGRGGRGGRFTGGRAGRGGPGGLGRFGRSPRGCADGLLLYSIIFLCSLLYSTLTLLSLYSHSTLFYSSLL